MLMKDRQRHKPTRNKPSAQPLHGCLQTRECESVVRLAGSLYCGNMSAYILQHSVRRTVNISPLQTSNGGGALGPPTLKGNTDRTRHRHRVVVHAWTLLGLPSGAPSSNPEQSYFLRAHRESLPVCFSLYKTYPSSCSADWHIQQHCRRQTNCSPFIQCRSRN